MLKPVLFATSMLFALPALAQETPTQDGAQPQQAPATPDTSTTAPAAQPAPAAAPSDAVAETTAPADQPQPAATQEQVAQAVGRDFGSYDKDADGALNQTEFAAWMGTLRKASEPSFQPGSPEAASWSAQAFTAADADKSASVNKQELTVFLTPKPS
jgi:hypothetical protein